MTELRQYDPVEVVGTWVTATRAYDILDGTVGQGTFAGTTKDNKRWTRENDRAGNSTRVKNNNRGGSLAITFSASSPTIRTLSIAAEKDDFTENEVGTIVLRDLNGKTVVEADGAFIEDTPDAQFGSDRGAVTWVWQCAAVRTFHGGHDLA